MVKCAKHEAGCAWTGSIGDYPGHFQSCRHDRPGQQDQQSATINNLNRRIAGLRDDNEELQLSKNRLLSENETLTSTIQGLMSEFQRVNTDLGTEIEKGMPLLGSNGGYAYNRENVVQLSGLIARNLENKPFNIDANKIYNCVKSCSDDLRKGFSDNPEHYYVDTRMLLSTCAASTWFTTRQRDNIHNWLHERGWN
jgi:hypothetical protein